MEEILFAKPLEPGVNHDGLLPENAVWAAPICLLVLLLHRLPGHMNTTGRRSDEVAVLEGQG